MKPDRWQEVERLYHAALEHEPAARAGFLSAACAGDEELRREVESLLAYEDQAAGFIETPAVEVAARSMADEPTPALAAGHRVGPYRVVAPLGAGGMGEVFLAEDSRLGRNVALKLLPEHLTREGGHLRRFEQEARAVASLSHPNVCTIHEVVQTDEGRRCLVMEYVEGVTLRQRLAEEGRLTLADALDVAVQVAAALAAAHAARVVHRDIKPENVMLRRDGYVKVLDFGLAKVSERPDASGRSLSTLETMIATTPGVLMGTVAYMSPEQARGLDIDARTDVWSLGVVLYEMVAGRRPFEGETATDVVLAIVDREPAPLVTAAPDTPAELEKIVERALAKQREGRYPTAEELLADLKALRRQLDLETAGGRRWFGRPATGGRGWLRAHRGTLAATVVLIFALVAGIVLLRRGREPQPAPSPVVGRVQRLTELAGIEEFPALSPDRKSVAFTAYVDGWRHLFVQLVAGGAPLQLTRDAADHQQARWTPDSSSLLYFAPPAAGATEGTIWEVPALGGGPRRVLASLGGADARIADGRLACFRLAGERVELVTAARDGSDLAVVARFVPGSYYLYPRWSPDGRWIAFQRGDGLRFDLFAVEATGGTPRPLTRESSPMNGFTWLPDSSGVVLSSSRASTVPYLPTFSLWEARLGGGDLRRLTPGDSSYLQPDMQAGGAIVAARMRIQLDLWRLPVDGDPAANVERARRLTRQTGYVQTPTAAPGEREVAFLADKGGHTNLWVLRTDSGELRQLTYERDPTVSVGVPIWSPDGRSIVFVSSRGNRGLGFGLWLIDPDGSNPRSLVPHGLGAAWSADGKWVYYVARASSGIEKVAASGGAPLHVRAEKARNVIGVFGSTLYFVVERPLVDGRPELEVRAATPEDGPSRLLARIPAARVPSWQVVNPALSPDGRWLAQALTDGFTTNLWALSAESGEWRQLTDFGDRTTFIARRVSWSSDGRSIFAAVGEGDADIVMLEMSDAAPR